MKSLRVLLVASFAGCACGPVAVVPTDLDGDGIVGDDRCVDEPEDLDEFEDGDGCPERDDDGDAITDADDVCPREPEDLDGFEDGDGCPDLDDDGDGIEGDCDLCPDAAEIYNGYRDDDGCPDRGRILLIDQRLHILDVIGFARGSARPNTRDAPILDAVASTMEANPRIEMLLVAGVALPNERGADGLALARARAVADALAERGVAPERLDVRGFVGDDAFPPELVSGSSAPPRPLTRFAVMRIGGWDQCTFVEGRLVMSPDQPPDPEYPEPPGPPPCPRPAD